MSSPTTVAQSLGCNPAPRLRLLPRRPPSPVSPSLKGHPAAHLVSLGLGANDGAVIADAFTAFRNSAAVAGGHTCEAGLLNIGTSAPAPAFPNCDVHPSQSGQQVLARAVEDAYNAAQGDD